MSAPLPSWVEDAARLPVAFAQVREDPLIDGWVVEQLGPGTRICMIASGGCTAAYLAGLRNVALIALVDANPAQMLLTQMKLMMSLGGWPVEERLGILGHLPMTVEDRKASLVVLFGPVKPEFWEVELEAWAAEGLDKAGRYERVFAQLQHELREHAGMIAELLTLHDPAEQARRVDPSTVLGRAMDEAFDRVMDLPILVRLFGEGATRNRVEPFSRHFARRTRWALGTLPAANNPYLWQVLRGCYPATSPVPWLLQSAPPPSLKFTWCYDRVMIDALKEASDRYDFVHLSNILDWLSPADACETLNAAHGALRPGGWVLIRQLNSSLDIPAAGPGFDWQTEQAAKLHAQDRSYFYRALHLGRRR